MDGCKDYEVLITDLEPPKPKDLDKGQLIRIINEKLRKNWTPQDRSIDLEIDIEPEWKQILREDGSILWDYQKLGWKAMHYKKTNQEGKVTREWLYFKHPHRKGENK